MTEVEWSAREQAVAGVVGAELGLPHMAQVRDIWDDTRPREANLAALRAADAEADAANLAFVRRVIEVACGPGPSEAVP